MSISITVLVYVIIPAAVIGLIAALSLAGTRDAKQPDRRYRPGRPYDFRPIWFLAAPEQVVGATGRPALTGGPVLEDSSGARVKPGSTGGASDSW
ncbi:aa3-type cytochrome oxidase subunit CtaJ [Paractinoplanes lichenicola]|uniref:Uncharacterized protein n=1 Tax=Paractinoplanes lichenicola TaxID=2802976 RepID=A0ABS1W0T0_9ACTN|nr:hypothetical protein [Actinoplanes lichenicola]MBL7260345.1 hypothetical protein [Actinoplanes lichenicola]